MTTQTDRVASPPEPRTIRLGDAARMLGVSRGHLGNLVRSGQVPALRLGRRVLISREWIDAAMAGASERKAS